MAEENDISISNIIFAVILLLSSMSVARSFKMWRIIPMGMMAMPLLSLLSGVGSGFLLYNEFK